MWRSEWRTSQPPSPVAARFASLGHLVQVQVEHTSRLSPYCIYDAMAYIFRLSEWI